MSELKPCPFCGGEVELRSTESAIAGNGGYYIMCFDCNLEMTRSYILKDYVRKNSVDGSPKARKDIIAAWNTRQEVSE